MIGGDQSMASKGEKIQSLRSDSLESLESPFFQEVLFNRSIEEDHETRATALEAESPFVSMVGSFEGERGSVAAPEDYNAEPVDTEPEGAGEEQDELNWEFDVEQQILEAIDQGLTSESEPKFGESYLEPNDRLSPGVEEGETAKEFTADAFAADKDGKDYFVRFPRLDNLTIQKATILAPSNFENLMDLMLASNQNNFVIDAHGDPIGLHMPLASATKISATKHSLFILKGIEYIRHLIRIAKEHGNFWGQASREDVKSWQKIVEVLHSKAWQEMIGPNWPTMAPQVSKIEEANRIVQSRLDSLTNSLFPGNVAKKQERVDRLLKKMLQLQARRIREIQFRACNIGKDPRTLYEFRKFFGADHICAPDIRSGMGFVIPVINRQAVDQLDKQDLTQIFNLPGGRFAIRIRISGTTFTVRAAADSQGAMMQWVASHIMDNSTYQGGMLPIHFLQTRPPTFPLDKDYAAHIHCRSSFWEGIVRANELADEAEAESASIIIRDTDTDMQHERIFDLLAGLEEFKSRENNDFYGEEVWQAQSASYCIDCDNRGLDRASKTADEDHGAQFVGQELNQAAKNQRAVEQFSENTWGLEGEEDPPLEIVTENDAQSESENEDPRDELEFEEDEGNEEIDPYFELQTVNPPKGLKLAEHFHLPKRLPDGTVATEARMQPQNMNPGFVSSLTDDLLVDRQTDGLQTRLDELIKTKYAKYLATKSPRQEGARQTDRIRVALVDLTGSKLFAPDLAGWGSTISTDGASVPKVCALYAVHQLRKDLNFLASRGSIVKKEDLIKAAWASWKKIGFSSMPKIEELFTFVVLDDKSRPVSATFSPDLLKTLTKAFANNNKCAVDQLILQLGFPYIASVMWQSGLRHPARGGLWLWGGYCCTNKEQIKRMLNSDTKSIECTIKSPGDGLSFRWTENPINQPRPVFAHNATALSVAAFFTLVAQGRLVEEDASNKIAATLQDACSFFWNEQLSGLSLSPPPTKCGTVNNLTHDAILITRTEGGKEIRYAAVALTVDAPDFPFEDFLKHLDKLIQDKN
jgi:hypothetical protein